MYIRRKVFSRLIDEAGQERLFSTTDIEELEQREFGKSQKNARQIAAQTKGAVEAAGKQNKFLKRVDSVKGAASKAGGLDKITNKEYLDWLKNEDFRKAVEGSMNGGEVKSQKLDQIAKGMEARSEIAADAITRRAKTHDSVRTAEGNIFKAGGKSLTVQASQEGQTAAKAVEGVHNGNATSTVVSKATEGRAKKMQNIQDRGVVAKESVPKPNMTVGKGRETYNRHQPKGKPGKINTTTNPGITFTDAPKNMTTVTSATPNRTVQVSTGMQQTPGKATPKRVTTINTTQHTPNNPPKAPKMPGTKPANQGNAGFNFGQFVKNNKVGLGAAAGAAAIGTGAYLLHRRNKKKREEERRRLEY